MIFAIHGHTFKYETEKLARAFFPFEKFIFTDHISETDEGIFTSFANGCVTARLYLDGREYSKTIELPADADQKTVELQLATALYFVLCEYSGHTQPWGILTGVRPAKLYSKLVRENGIPAAEKYFTDVLKVSENKLGLCRACAESEREIIEKSRPDSFSLYVSIPFCPSRCSYCSFVSHSIDKAAGLIPTYFDLLLKEIKMTADLTHDLGLKLATVYIGGGTPSILTALQTDVLLREIITDFDMSSCMEFTFEAGRPETITEDKLRVLVSHGVSRISINPQTFNEETLVKIGRKHTVTDVYNAYETARKCGIGHINTDLIAGLADETFDDFAKTVNAACTLDPESITVHTLSMKRAAALSRQQDMSYFEKGSTVSDMVDFARKRLTDGGYLPYYMYRQSKTVGNLENVGYAKSGYSGLYNVYIMDETHSIFACGASAVTKLRVPDKNIIERVYNFKYPYEYISRFDELCARKDNVYEFYKKYNLI